MILMYMAWQNTFRAGPTAAGMLRDGEINHDMLSVLVGRVCPTDAEAFIKMTMYEDSGEGITQTGVLEADGELFGFRVSLVGDNKLEVEVDVVEEKLQHEEIAVGK